MSALSERLRALEDAGVAEDTEVPATVVEVREALRKAWNEGYEAGDSDVRDDFEKPLPGGKFHLAPNPWED